jgi:hypothetical protein
MMQKFRGIHLFQVKWIRLSMVAMRLMSCVNIAALLIVMSVNVMLVNKRVFIEIPKFWLRKPFQMHYSRPEGHSMKTIAPRKLRYLLQVHPSLHGLTCSAVQYFLTKPSPDPIIRLSDSSAYPFHCLLGSMLRALSTIVKLAGPQYSGSDYVVYCSARQK